MLLLLTALTSLTTALALSERATLLRLYSDANGSRWKKDKGWRAAGNGDDPVPICSWHGVTCMDDSLLDDEGVVGLDLSDNNLSGRVPKALWSMLHLSTVNFQGNKIKDGGFDGFPSGAPVSVINLSQNRLTHVTGISSAPKSLKELRLGSNSFDGKFPSEILELDRLKKLYLSYNPGISGNVPSDIGDMTRLTELELSFTSLHGNIPSEFGLLKDLTYLGMDETHIHGPIPAELDDMQQIKYLSIESSQPGSGDLSGPLPSFNSLMYLKHLRLNGNLLTGTVPTDFLSDVIATEEPLAIGLSDNRIHGELPSELKRFEKLQIDVQGNRMGGIPPELCEMNEWNGGAVGLFGCDGIACPTGTFSDQGRKEDPNDVCVKCPRDEDAKYVGMSQCRVETDEPELIPDFPPQNDGITATTSVPEKGRGDFPPQNDGITTTASVPEKEGGLPGFAKFMVVLVGLAVSLAILAVLRGAHIRNKSGRVKEDSPTVMANPDGDSSSDMSGADASPAEEQFEIGMTNDEEIGHDGILL